MSETDSTTPQPEIVASKEDKLKYLEFVQVSVLQIFLFVSKVYGYAKENSGPLKPGVETIEGTLKTVVGPAYNKFHNVPVELLKFIDRKVDDTVNKLDSQVPPIVKQVSNNTFAVASELRTSGLLETASGLAKSTYSKVQPAAKEIYSKYEPVAEQYAVSTWHSLNQITVFNQVAKLVVPTAAYYSEKYNETVQQTAAKGYKFSSYLPLVPIEKIAKMFGSPDAQPAN